MTVFDKTYTEEDVKKETERFEEEKASTEGMLVARRKQFADALKNELGDDIKKVLNGEIKVKPTLKERFTFKIRCMLERLFKIF